MATIRPTNVLTDLGARVVTWTNLVQATSDVGQAVIVADYPELSIMAIGTNATTVVIQGSMDGTNWTTLGAGVTLTIGASGMSPVIRIAERPLFLRPSTPSAAADTDVILLMGGHR